MTQTDPCQKVQTLKAYVQKYAGQGHAVRELRQRLSVPDPLPEPSRPPRSIQYGEKALTMEGIDDATKIQLLVTLSSLYIQSGPEPR